MVVTRSHAHDLQVDSISAAKVAEFLPRIASWASANAAHAVDVGGASSGH
jgi:hypothetical protein